MYELKTTTGAVVGLTEDPTFIRYHAPECYVVTDELNAQGVSYHGTAYNLAGRDGVGAVETVSIRKVDAGDVSAAQGFEIDALHTAQQDTDEQTVELAYRLSLMELGVN